MSTFVALGNAHQPFTRLLDFIEANASLFPQPVIVQRGHTPFVSARLHCLDFTGMEAFETLVREADLVIMHAGGGGVMQAVAAGKVPVVVPRRGSLGEHVDDHQVENGKALAAGGKVVFAANPEDIPAAVLKALDLQRHAAAPEPPPLLAEIRRLLADHANSLEQRK